MENAADALKLSFAIIVFVVALTILFVTSAKVKSTSDMMFWASDNTNFRAHTVSRGLGDLHNGNRTVRYSEVVSTLYRYYNESVAVKVVLNNGNTYNFDIGSETKLDDHGNILATGPKLNSIEDIENNLAIFVDQVLYQRRNSEFIEEFIEVPISGIYITAADGSEVTLSQGGRQVYITYTEV